MKVLFKIKGVVHPISSVSVDDKCFPLVGGIHPFSASSKSSSPLARESPLWFKTLAVDSVYFDCDVGLIFWTAVKNDHAGEEVELRQKDTAGPSYQSDFVPQNARPLVSDLSLFDFDPSYKEMIIKGQEVAKKLKSKSISVNDSNCMVANLLHVYILPSIKFTSDDHYALSRARCLIEERHVKSDGDIAAKAKAINLLQLSLDNLKDNLLMKDDFESETFLRTCSPKFLEAFLGKIEEDSTKLNLDLDAEQSKVNWAKEQCYEADYIADLQKTRNSLFEEVNRLLRVREALKNVMTRKINIKKRKARRQIVDSCFHNVFLEIRRRLEVEDKTLKQLVEDKLKISAAREAVLAVVLEFNDNTRIPSDRSTRFDPVGFDDYGFDGSNPIEKSDAWLTLQERVSKALKDESATVTSVHLTGCKSLKLQIDVALSEFNLHLKKQTVGVDEESQFNLEIRSHGDKSAPPVNVSVSNTMSETQTPDDGQNALLTDKGASDEINRSVDHEAVKLDFERPDNKSQLSASPQLRPLSTASHRSGVFIPNEFDVSDAIDIETTLVEGKSQKDALDVNQMDERDKEHLANKDGSGGNGAIDSQDYVVIEGDVSEWTDPRMPATPHEDRVFFVSENLAINTLMFAVENIKSTVHDQFKEVVTCLLNQLKLDSMDPFEILWKAYERHFSKEVLSSLTTLYSVMLETGTRDVYKEIRKMSLQDLLEDDKILNLFFRPNSYRISNTFFDHGSPSMDAISMAKTLSSLSLDIRQYSVNQLYELANADSNDLCERFQLTTDEDHSDEGAVGSASSSSDSGTSVKTTDLFDGLDAGEEDEGISHSNNTSSHSSPNAEQADTTDTSKSNTLESGHSLSFANFNNGQRSNHSPPGSPLTDDVNKHRSLAHQYFDSEAENNQHHHRRPPSESRQFLNPHEIIINVMDPVLSPFRNQVVKCMNANSILDKVRYLSKAVQNLNNDISRLYGNDHMSACDDIISMLVLSLANMPQDVFVGLYSNLRLLIDILPPFLSGSLCDFNLVSMFAAYNYLLNRNVCKRVVRRYAASFTVKHTQ